MTYVSTVIVKIIFIKETKYNHFSFLERNTLRGKIKIRENETIYNRSLWLWITMIIGSA